MAITRTPNGISFDAKLFLFIDHPTVKQHLTSFQRSILGSTGAYGRKVMRNQIRPYTTKAEHTVVDPFVKGVFVNPALEEEEEIIRRKKSFGKGYTMYHVPKKGMVTDARTGRPVTTEQAEYARVLLNIKRAKMTRRDSRWGNPPRSITGKLRKGIRYGVEIRPSMGTASVVIGVAPFPTQPTMVGRVSVPELLNKGGTQIIDGSPVVYAPRPYVETVLDATFNHMTKIMQVYRNVGA